jgi:hypothetical protein
MRNSTLAPAVWLASAVFLSSACLGIRGWAATARDASAPVTDQCPEMVTTLQAGGPHPSLGEQAKVFDRLVGVWDGEYTEYSREGKETRSSGEWLFGWVMDGRAMQGLFIIDPSAVRKERYFGTTLSYFDSKPGTWSMTLVDPENGAVETLTGGSVGDDRVVLLGQDTDGKESRWSFDHVRPDSWVFRDEASSDGGKTWRIRELDRMTRRGAPPVVQLTQ